MSVLGECMCSVTIVRPVAMFTKGVGHFNWLGQSSSSLYLQFCSRTV